MRVLIVAGRPERQVLRNLLKNISSMVTVITVNRWIYEEAIQHGLRAEMPKLEEGFTNNLQAISQQEIHETYIIEPGHSKALKCLERTTEDPIILRE